MSNKFLASILVFVSLAVFRHVIATSDITLAELEYVADHLSSVECSKLIIALQMDKGKNLEDCEPECISMESMLQSCLANLIQWNSKAADETQADLSRRLLQIGRKDLGNWLTRTVFDELGYHINESIVKDPFKEMVMPSPSNESRKKSNFVDMDFTAHEDHWMPIDTIIIVVIGSVCCVLLVIGYSLTKLILI
ncbi:uncharacterized protein LOC106665601 isoform X1 [Cimex lectularius]|uniref:Transmembrane protein n=1 Tax=Cimex lectularius TaxID=79782 RepID=A0A8I6TDQ7_CIMLE|nr:uncharacterized protein LOC106665601 isoform X1 [Cimex lectularius]